MSVKAVSEDEETMELLLRYKSKDSSLYTSQQESEIEPLPTASESEGLSGRTTNETSVWNEPTQLVTSFEATEPTTNEPSEWQEPTEFSATPVSDGVDLQSVPENVSGLGIRTGEGSDANVRPWETRSTLASAISRALHERSVQIQPLSSTMAQNTEVSSFYTIDEEPDLLPVENLSQDQLGGMEPQNEIQQASTTSQNEILNALGLQWNDGLDLSKPRTSRDIETENADYDLHSTSLISEVKLPMKVSIPETEMIDLLTSPKHLKSREKSDVSVNIKEVSPSTSEEIRVPGDPEVIDFLTPHLNKKRKKLSKEWARERKKAMAYGNECGSKQGIEDILTTIKTSRVKAELSDSSEEDKIQSPPPKEKQPEQKKLKCTKVTVKALKRKEKTLNRIIAKKLDHDDKVFDFVEPLLAREPYYLMNNRVDEYMTIAQHLPKLSFKLGHNASSFKDLNLLDFRKYESNNQSVVDALWDALMFLKVYIEATDARIYHSEGDCIVRYVKEPCNRHPTNWPVEPGTIAAAYAAHVCETLHLERKDFYKQNHPLGLGIAGEQPQRTVVLPLLTPNNRVLAVMEFDKNESEFTEEMIHYALAYGSWVTAALIRKGIRESLKDAKEYNNTILNCLKCFLHEKLSLNQCISAVMYTMREFIRAEEVIFYHIIADKKLDADIYQATQSNRDVFTKVSKKIDLRKDFLMKDVAENHTVVNIYKNDGDHLFRTYNIFDPDIKSILCVPIGNPKRLLGIVKVINKIDHPMFFGIDVVNVSNAGMYCTSIIFYTAIGKQLDNTITIANKQKVTLTRHMIPCIHDIIQFRTRPKTKPPPYYLSFDWYPTKDELAKDLLADYAWWMFNDLFESDVFMEKFDVFLLMCKKGYRKTSSYHNFEHAFCATHCMFVIVRTCSQKFSYLEQMALMCAMLCHDIDHPGNTNPFLKASEHPLSKLYKFAFLENHHSNVTRILINHCKIFDHLAPDDYKAMVDDMHRLIVATDLAKHFRKKKYLDDMVKDKRFDESLPAHKMHLKSIIMTTCDLSGQFKPFDRTRDITFSLYIELYKEGDWLKSKGLPVHSTLDRTRYLDIPQDQVNFLSMVVIPCVQLLLQMVPVLKDPYTLSCNNIDIWKRITFSKLFH